MLSDANAIGTKHNAVLYLDREIVGRLNLEELAIQIEEVRKCFE